MLKILVKKQMMEYFRGYFVSAKTGKTRSKASSIAFFVLFAAILAMIAATFGMLCFSICGPLTMLGFDALYFSLLSIMAVFIGVFGSVFNTYAGLYRAKDNDMLLSMPIKTSLILISRLASVYIMGVLYESIIIIPAVVVYCIVTRPSALLIIASVFLILILGLFVLAITCALGWIVAMISSKIKKKSIISTIFTLLFIGVYYFVYFNLDSFIRTIIQNPDSSDIFVKNWLYPFYLSGLAFSGDVISVFAFCAMCILLAMIVVFLMSKNFAKIATSSSFASSNKKYTSKSIKKQSISKALLKKEFLHFVQTPTYLLNCGLGILILPAAAIVLLVKKAAVNTGLAIAFAEVPSMAKFLPLIGSAICLMVASIDGYTAPSVSLEGKNIWIVQASPVDAKEVLRAKQNAHIIMNVPPALIFSCAVCYVFEMDFSTVIYSVLLSVLGVMFISAFGLMLNLKMPNLTWTNDTVPIKQSMPVTINIFGWWGIALIYGAGFYLFRNICGADEYMLGAIIVFAFATRLMNNWIYTKGAEIFSKL